MKFFIRFALGNPPSALVTRLGVLRRIKVYLQRHSSGGGRRRSAEGDSGGDSENEFAFGIRCRRVVFRSDDVVHELLRYEWFVNPNYAVAVCVFRPSVRWWRSVASGGGRRRL